MMAIRKDKDKKKKKEKDKKALLHLVTLVHFDLPNYCLCVMYCFLVFLLLGCVCVFFACFFPPIVFGGVLALICCFLVSLFASLCLVYLAIWWPQCYLAWPLASLFFFLGWYIWYGLQLTSTVLWRSLEHRKKLLSGEAERQELGRNQSSRRTEKQATKRWSWSDSLGWGQTAATWTLHELKIILEVQKDVRTIWTVQHALFCLLFCCDCYLLSWKRIKQDLR